jgi:hypothetical protein
MKTKIILIAIIACITIISSYYETTKDISYMKQQYNNAQKNGIVTKVIKQYEEWCQCHNFYFLTEKHVKVQVTNKKRDDLSIDEAFEKSPYVFYNKLNPEKHWNYPYDFEYKFKEFLIVNIIKYLFLGFIVYYIIKMFWRI